MRIVEVVRVEGCLDSSPVLEYVVEPAVDKALMKRLGEDAEVQYFPQFPRPYFRVDRARGYVAQGVFGSDRLRVTFSPRAEERTEAELRSRIEGG